MCVGIESHAQSPSGARIACLGTMQVAENPRLALSLFTLSTENEPPFRLEEGGSPRRKNPLPEESPEEEEQERKIDGERLEDPSQTVPHFSLVASVERFDISMEDDEDGR